MVPASIKASSPSSSDVSGFLQIRRPIEHRTTRFIPARLNSLVTLVAGGALRHAIRRSRTDGECNTTQGKGEERRRRPLGRQRLRLLPFPGGRGGRW